MYKILIVEDDVNLLDLYCSLLESEAKLEVSSAENGKAALQTISKWRPDLIVSDVMMPVCDGVELLKQVSQMQQPIPILFVSGFANQNEKDLLDNPNCVGFLKKPISMEVLLKNIFHCLGKG